MKCAYGPDFTNTVILKNLSPGLQLAMINYVSVYQIQTCLFLREDWVSLTIVTLFYISSFINFQIYYKQENLEAFYVFLSYVRSENNFVIFFPFSITLRGLGETFDVLLDLSKAFNRVWQGTLISKNSPFGINISFWFSFRLFYCSYCGWPPFIFKSIKIDINRCLKVC